MGFSILKENLSITITDLASTPRQNGIVKLMNGVEKVLDILKKNPNATIKMISNEADLSVRTIQRILVSLKENDLLIRSGSDKTGYWEVLDNK